MGFLSKSKKYKFTEPELRGRIYSALMWASDGLEFRVGDGDPKPLIMGDPHDVTVILVEALTNGLPNGEDSPASTA